MVVPSMTPTSGFTLRDYQIPIADHIFDYMRSNKGKHPLIGMPTGSGKTVVMADIVSKAINRWNSNVLILSHVKEILEQDKRAIEAHTARNVSIYSAGLGKREIGQITIAGIQSVYSKPELFKRFNLVIIDECHLIPENSSSMYRQFFAGLGDVRYLGLTATPFRLGKGYIYGQEDSLFDAMPVDLTSLDKFNSLIEKRYLCKLKTLSTSNEFDVSNIKTVAGDFDLKQMSLTFDRDRITQACVRAIIKHGQPYKKWLIFAIDIAHAENIATALRSAGVPSMAVHSKLEIDRSAILSAFRKGEIKAIVNVNVLTTGFDDPDISLIALMRPTKSPVVHVQTIGRGLRIAPGKDHCLVLDFAGNTERLGPINDIKVKRKSKGVNGEPITKKCPKCEAIHHPTAKVCDFCDHIFKFKTLLRSISSSAEIIRENKQKWFDVDNVKYSIHQKRNTPDSLKVTYESGIRFFNEWICIDHPGYAGAKGKLWAKNRGVEADSIEELVDKTNDLRKPSRILVDFTAKYPSIVGFDFHYPPSQE